MTSTKTLTRSTTLILSMATVCLAVTAQIAPATTPADVVFSTPTGVDVSYLDN